MTRLTSAPGTIVTLLEAQRQALLSGDLARLAGMEARLAAALERLGDVLYSTEDLAMIADLATRNARLLEAARAGVASARARPRQGTGGGLKTYDARGRQHGGAAVGQTLARR